MEAIVEVTATAPTQAVLQKSGRLKNVRFVSSPSPSEAVRRLVVARISDFDERPAELRHLAAHGSFVPTPLVLMALGKRQPTAAGLQLLALFASRFCSGKGDPFVAPSVEAARRLLAAHVLGAEQKLVADAQLDDGTLSVWSCEPKLYECAITEIPALSRLDAKTVGKFEISASGSRLHWPGADVDLDMDSIREYADPKARKEATSKYRSDAARYGAAIRMLREARGIRQTGIAGLSEREMRRLEKNEVLPHSDTLKKLAAAHGWSVAEYMEKLAAESKQRSGRSHR
jgi:hypothetical protein